MRVVVTLVLLTSFCATFAQDGSKLFHELGQPAITVFPAKYYAAHPNNFDVTQDRRGVMYFSNLWGILQYDGTRFEIIPLPNGSSCTSLAVDKDGTIYAGGRNEVGFLETDSVGGRKFTSLLSTKSQNEEGFHEVWRIVTTEEGVFFSSFEKLLFLKRGTRKVETLLDHPWHVFEALGSVYISAQNGLYQFNNGTLNAVNGIEKTRGLFITGISHLGSDLLISTSERGMFLFDGSIETPWSTSLNDEVRKHNPTRVVNHDNRFLIASTELNGIYVANLKGEIIHHFNRQNGLPDNHVTNFYVDGNDLLWMSTYNGLCFFSLSGRVKYVDINSGVPGIPYSSAVYRNKLYLATSEGLFLKSATQPRGETFSRVDGVNGLVWSLAVIDDKLFCGQAITALIIEGDDAPRTLYNEGTWVFEQLSDEKIVFATYSGLHLLRKTENHWTYDGALKGYKGSSRSMARDKFGDLWLGLGNNGVAALRLNAACDSVISITQYTDTGGNRLTHANYVTVLGDRIAIASAQGALYIDHVARKLVPFAKWNQHLRQEGSAHVRKIIPGLDGSALMVSDRGSLHEFSISSDSLLFSSGTLNGSLISDFEHIARHEEIAIVGTLDGFALVDTRVAAPRTRKSFSAYLSEVRNHEGILQRTTEGNLFEENAIPFRANALTFTFGSSAYESNNKNTYHYYLEGFDKEKSFSSSRHPVKEYANLSEGTYRFHLQVQDADNLLSTETTYGFTVLPPWYRSVGAYIGYTFAFIVFNLFMYRLIRSKIQREKKRTSLEAQRNSWLKEKNWHEVNLRNQQELMKLQEQKLEAEKIALQQKNLMIENEKQRERELLEMERERFELDLRHKNQELTSLTLHITQKNEILTRVSSEISKSLKETTDEAAARNLRDLKNWMQKTINSSAEWDRFADHFDSVHEGFLRKLRQRFPDLSNSTLKLSALIRMRLSSKQIATLMNTAPESVLKARYRLRIKFGLDKDRGLEEFLDSI